MLDVFSYITKLQWWSLIDYIIVSILLSPPQIYYTIDIGISEFGFVINIIMVVVVSLHLALETLHWVILLISPHFE